MSLLWILVIVLLVLAVAGAPTWPYSTGWSYGWGPSGFVGLLVIVLIILLLTGRL
jgi:hypothetical protein